MNILRLCLAIGVLAAAPVLYSPSPYDPHRGQTPVSCRQIRWGGGCYDPDAEVRWADGVVERRDVICARSYPKAPTNR